MRAFLLAAALAIPASALADDETDRLRAALRQVTIDLRAAQDQQTELQARLDEANKQRSLLQQQVAALQAKAAATPAAPAAKPPPPDLVRNLQSSLATARSENTALRGGLSRWQGAYQQAATIARDKDAQAQALAGTGKAEAAQLKTCEAANEKLVGVANDILHLYRTQNFHSILVWSYEPLIGFDQVKLENIVQDYEDRIRAQAYAGPYVPRSPSQGP